MQFFERHLEDNLFDLYFALKTKNYKHGSYFEFFVNDPKRRHIHKAKVCDRIVHHLLYKYLYSLFDKTFIFDSYSCRSDKGTHRVVKRLEKFTRIVSKNYSQDCWALKLDIKKFFASVDHEILKKLVASKVEDNNILGLINEVIDSYSSGPSTGLRVNSARSYQVVLASARTIKYKFTGIPLGNLTSQIFANIYLNELDQFVKHELKVRHYLRYADDFIILNTNLNFLLSCFETVKQFLGEKVKLELHPDKIITRNLNWGIDFCGYIVLPHYILPRTKTKRRIIKKVEKGDIGKQAQQSYLGFFSHATSYMLVTELKNLFFLNKTEHYLD